MSTEGTTEPDEQPVEETATPEPDAVRADATTVTEDEEPEEREAVDVDHAPPRLSQALSVGAVVAGAVLTAPFAILAIPFALAGAAIVAAGLFVVESRGWLSIGTAFVLLGALVSGAYGAVPAELMLVGVALTVLAWDVGQHGISIGEQLGRATRTRRLQLVHAATSAMAIGLVGFVTYFVYLFSTDGRPGPAVALLVVGIVVLVWTLRS